MTAATGHLTDAQAQRLVDGLLLAGELDGAASHATACPDCATLVESYRALSRALERLPAPELPAGFTAGVLERVDARQRAVDRERRAAAAVVAGALGALLIALFLGGNHAWVPSVARLAGQLGVLADAVRLGSGALPPLLRAFHLPIAAACAALILPLLFALSRLMRSPRAQTV
jgi:anti-sigma factor RsiW